MVFTTILDQISQQTVVQSIKYVRAMCGDDKLMVLQGSKISNDVTEGMPQGYLDLRNELIADGTIVNGIFIKDYIFSSSSAAAAVVLGRSANGRKEWTLLDGRSYGKFGQIDGTIVED